MFKPSTKEKTVADTMRSINSNVQTRLRPSLASSVPSEPSTFVQIAKQRRVDDQAHKRRTGEGTPLFGAGYQPAEDEQPTVFDQEPLGPVLAAFGRKTMGCATSLVGAIAVSHGCTEQEVCQGLQAALDEKPAFFALVDPSDVDFVAAAFFCDGLLVLADYRCRLFLCGCPWPTDLDLTHLQTEDDSMPEVVVAFDGFDFFYATAHTPAALASAATSPRASAPAPKDDVSSSAARLLVQQNYGGW